MSRWLPTVLLVLFVALSLWWAHDSWGGTAPRRFAYAVPAGCWVTPNRAFRGLCIDDGACCGDPLPTRTPELR